MFHPTEEFSSESLVNVETQTLKCTVAQVNLFSSAR